MNKLELFVYQLVKNNPRLKNLVRDIYQAPLNLVRIPNEKSLFPVSVREGYFYGFHDKNPWSADNRFLLAHGFNDLANAEPKPGDKTDIGFFRGNEYSEFTKVAETGCFNWQQGSMLQWFGKSGELVFNDSEDGENIARIFNTEGRAVGKLPLAIAAVNPLGTLALSYNFARLQQHFPGYGYVHGSDPEIDSEAPASHGISAVDVPGNTVRKLFSVHDIASYQPEKSMAGAFHFLTHCLFSPSGERFLFLHRWIRKGNFSYTRMFSCDTKGEHLHLFPTHEMVSHIAWQDESHVLAYCRSLEKRDGYVLFNDRSREYRQVGSGSFNSDGHPSFPAGNPLWFITDTYPDRLRRSFLILFDMLNEKRTDLGYFRQPISYKEAIRCDLHPRWNNNGTMICFDSAHTGKRSLCTMNIGNFLAPEISS
jgi:hypothetical protein